MAPALAISRAAPINTSFCVPYETQLVVKPKAFSSRRANRSPYTVKDNHGSIVFNMELESEGFSCTGSPTRRIYDATSGKVLLVIQKKLEWFGRPAWIAFHGERERKDKLLFTMRKSPAFVVGYEVFLQGDILEENDDFSKADFFLKKKSGWFVSDGFSLLSNGRVIAAVTAESLLPLLSILQI